MERRGAIIEAPHGIIPHCGATSDAGYHVLIAADGRYTLVYSERGVPGVIASSSDPESLMERVFVEITTNMAAMEVAAESPPLDAVEALRLSQLSDDQIRAMAIDCHLRSSRIQEALLGKLSPEWRARRSVWNDDKLIQIKKLFLE
jgi:hypothetical protein